jgi:hypothetical protein
VPGNKCSGAVGAAVECGEETLDAIDNARRGIIGQHDLELLAGLAILLLDEIGTGELNSSAY